MIATISDSEIEEAQSILLDHQVKDSNRRSALESLVFAIGSQATPFEIATKIIFNLRDLAYPNQKKARQRYTSIKALRNPKLVQKAMENARWRFWNEGRAVHAMEYFGSLKGNWWEEIANADIETRKKYVKEVKWVAERTFSFWNIILGGHKLLAIDTHIAGNLAKLGFEIPQKYYVPVRRNPGKQTFAHIQEADGVYIDTRNGQQQFFQEANGLRPQKVRETPTFDYEGIENSARDFFAQDQRFLINGEVNFA